MSLAKGSGSRRPKIQYIANGVMASHRHPATLSAGIHDCDEVVDARKMDSKGYGKESRRDCMQFDDAIRRYTICGHTICALVAVDEAIHESHTCMDIAPFDGPSVIFFSSEP